MITPAFKSALHQTCENLLLEKIRDVKKQISELNLSFENDGKSSAGDKHETSRAMAQLETEKLHHQLHQFEIQLSTLRKLNPEKINETIQPGSLVETNNGLFYIAVPIGKILISENEIMVISALSPMGKLLTGKKNGSCIQFNNLNKCIKQIL